MKSFSFLNKLSYANSVDVQIIAIEAENQILFSVHKRMENRPNIKI